MLLLLFTRVLAGAGKWNDRARSGWLAYSKSVWKEIALFGFQF